MRQMNAYKDTAGSATRLIIKLLSSWDGSSKINQINIPTILAQAMIGSGVYVSIFDRATNLQFNAMANIMLTV